MTEKELIDVIKAEADYLYGGGQNIRIAKHALIRAAKAHADSIEKTSREQFEARVNLLQESNDAKDAKIEHLQNQQLDQAKMIAEFLKERERIDAENTKYLKSAISVQEPYTTALLDIRDLKEENEKLRDSRELARKQRNDYEKKLIESRSQIHALNERIGSLQTLVDSFCSPQDTKKNPADSTWIGDMSNSFDKWLRILKKNGKITIREDGGSPSNIRLTEGRYESDWFFGYDLNEVIDWVSTRGGLEFLSPIDVEPAMITQFPSVNFEDLAIGDEFYCYGDILMNYDYPKWCRCIKVSESSGIEMGGISFLVRNTKVFIDS